jgi:hypothetical protein
MPTLTGGWTPRYDSGGRPGSGPPVVTRVLCLALLAAVVVGCRAGPATATVSPTSNTSVEILGTSVEPPVDGLPVVAFHVRARMQAGKRSLSVAATVKTSPDTTQSNPRCDAGYLTAQPLMSSDAGAVYPSLYQNVAAGDAVRDGWIAFSLEAGSRVSRQCVLVFTLQTAYVSFCASPSASPGSLWAYPFGQCVGPVGIEIPDYVDQATVQVRGDGSALTESPFPAHSATASP